MDSLDRHVDDGIEWRPLGDEGFIALVGPIWAAPVVDGVGRFRFLAEPKHHNINDVVQGGMLLTFADRCMGEMAKHDEPARRQATVQLDYQFLDAVQIGETVDLKCRVLRKTKMLVFMDGVMTVGDRTVAVARGIWKATNPRAAGS